MRIFRRGSKNEKFHFIKGPYVVSTEDIPLNKRESNALDEIVRECEVQVYENGYPNPEWSEATAIKRFVITNNRSLARLEHVPPSKPIFGRGGDVYITFDCIHDKADKMESSDRKLSRMLFFPHAFST